MDHITYCPRDTSSKGHTDKGKRWGTPRSETDSNTAPFLTGKICSHDQRDRLVFDADTVTTKTPPTIQ